MHTAMWTACARAARLLDAADDDWRALQEIDDILRPLAQDLARATATERATTGGARAAHRAERELGVLAACLTWVGHHVYDASEAELESRLGTALQAAMNVLDALERSHAPGLDPIAGSVVLGAVEGQPARAAGAASRVAGD